MKTSSRLMPDLVQLEELPAAAGDQPRRARRRTSRSRGDSTTKPAPPSRGRQRPPRRGHAGQRPGAPAPRRPSRPPPAPRRARSGKTCCTSSDSRALRHDAPAVDDDDAVAHHRHLGQDVRRQDHRVLAGQRLDQRADLRDLPRVEPDGGLVEDQHLRIAQERLRQTDPLPVALGELADQPVAACRR